MLLLVVVAGHLFAQPTIGTFVSVQPTGPTEMFDIPSTHRFQVLLQAGDSLSTGGYFRNRPDFTGFVPMGGSSTLGRLGVNVEDIPGGATVLDLSFDSGQERWDVTAGQHVDFSVLTDSGLVATARNCSGGITPWGTIITCEEQTAATDLDSNGYLDLGWAIEYDPATRQVMDQDGDSLPDKLWAMGCFRHENAVVASDSVTIYQGEDNAAHGFLFKFIADAPGRLGSGRLYVLQVTGNTGVWLQVPNTTQRERNLTVLLADSVGGTSFLRVEDVEIGPEGKVYFASTLSGNVYRFRDHGNTVSHFEAFVNFNAYPIHHRNGVTNALFSYPDNLAFDGEGNLWVLQDGGSNFIWVVGKNHSAQQPDIRIFANSPIGAEPTGITFSPDFKFLFMSIQHPSPANSVPMVDASGNTVYMNRDATIVIARAEDLGSPTVLGGPADPAAMLVYPVPATDVVWAEVIAADTGIGRIRFIDPLGRVCMETWRDLEAGPNRVLLDVATLPAGHYVLELVADSERWVRPLIVR